MNRADRLRSLLEMRPVCGDGATGTQLQKLGLRPGEPGERWNVEAPDKVRLVHQRYLDAGADLLTTNSFGGTSLALAGHGLDGRAETINRSAAALAREVAGECAFVLGDIGPFGGLLEPYGETVPETAAAAFRAQAAALLAGGADAILVETMSDPAEATLAIAAAREAGAALVVATFTFQGAGGGFRTMMGVDPATAVAAALAAGADIVGANCGTELSLEDYVRLASELAAAAAGRPVIVQPNAGSPVMEAGAAVYRMKPDGFTGIVPRYLTAGVRIVGGCCGTGPEHIAAIARALRTTSA